MTQKKGQLARLNDVLFEQLDRLCGPDADAESLQGEIARSKAVSGLAANVIANSRLLYEANREAVSGRVAEAAGKTCRSLIGGGE